MIVIVSKCKYLALPRKQHSVSLLIVLLHIMGVQWPVKEKKAAVITPEPEAGTVETHMPWSIP